MRTKLLATALAAALLCGAGAAQAAGEIIAPVSGVVDVGGPGFGTLDETINQAGLFSGYVGGVTDFDTYIATDPKHSVGFTDLEWFSNSGTTSAEVTYDFGSLVTIDRLALWNEESSGIGLLELFANGNSLGVFNPTDNPLIDAGYSADVFAFAAVTTQFVTFRMSGCPQSDPGSFPACAIAEVAFRSAGEGGVPEPATWGLMIGGFGLAGSALRRRRALGA